MAKSSGKPSIEISGWVWKALAAVAIAVMAMLLSQGASHENVTYLSVRDKAKLKEVFFGNETWTVLCVNQTTIVSRLLLSLALLQSRRQSS